MYPRQCLTSHFWTLQQRSEFAVMNLRDRLSHNRPVFRNLQNKLETLKNDRHYEQWKTILGKLGSGVHPSVEEIIAVKDLFAETPYKTGSLSYTHIVSDWMNSVEHSVDSEVYNFILHFNRITWPDCMESKRYLPENPN